MRNIFETGRFRKDLKREKRRGRDLRKLVVTVDHLVKEGLLSVKYKPHPLAGEWKGVWDCHIEPDWLLLYEVTPVSVTLYRTGTHSDLFE